MLLALFAFHHWKCTYPREEGVEDNVDIGFEKHHNRAASNNSPNKDADSTHKEDLPRRSLLAQKTA